MNTNNSLLLGIISSKKFDQKSYKVSHIPYQIDACNKLKLLMRQGILDTLYVKISEVSSVISKTT